MGVSTIEGLTLDVDLPRAAMLQIQAYGVQRTTGTGYCHVGYRYVVDGVARGQPDWGLLIQMSDSGSSWHHGWSMLGGETLAAGRHSIAIQARSEGPGGCNVCAEANRATPAYDRCAMNVMAFYQ